MQARALLALARNAGATFAAEARVVDANSSQELVVDFRGRLATVGTTAIILATGAKERFLPFPGWTLPGVTGVGGLQALLKSGLRLPAKRVVLAGTGPLLFPVATALTQAGAEVVLVAEQVSRLGMAGFGVSLLRSPQKLLEGVRHRTAWLGVPYRTSSWVTRADGEGRLRSVTMSEQGRVRTIACDWLGAAMGLVPNTELGQLLGCHATVDGLAVDALQQTSVAGIWAAGECTGVKGEDAGIVEGEIAGAIAAGAPKSSMSGSLFRARDAGRSFGRRLNATFAPRPEVLALAEGDTIVCRCEDVRRDAIDPAWTQRQAKLWTRVGMGACQGAVCGPACSALFGWDGNAVRPPLSSPAVGPWAEALPPER